MTHRFLSRPGPQNARGHQGSGRSTLDGHLHRREVRGFQLDRTIVRAGHECDSPVANCRKPKPNGSTHAHPGAAPHGGNPHRRDVRWNRPAERIVHAGVNATHRTRSRLAPGPDGEPGTQTWHSAEATWTGERPEGTNRQNRCVCGGVSETHRLANDESPSPWGIWHDNPS